MAVPLEVAKSTLTGMADGVSSETVTTWLTPVSLTVYGSFEKVKNGGRVVKLVVAVVQNSPTALDTYVR